ncbi:hypothetical protein SNEBB_003275 [Seison nebaliae]|nr:hypothetical protein SNEBB_003275 [Seison nebaliae]
MSNNFEFIFDTVKLTTFFADYFQHNIHGPSIYSVFNIQEINANYEEHTSYDYMNEIKVRYLIPEMKKKVEKLKNIKNKVEFLETLQTIWREFYGHSRILIEILMNIFHLENHMKFTMAMFDQLIVSDENVFPILNELIMESKWINQRLYLVDVPQKYLNFLRSMFDIINMYNPSLRVELFYLTLWFSDERDNIGDLINEREHQKEYMKGLHGIRKRKVNAEEKRLNNFTIIPSTGREHRRQRSDMTHGRSRGARHGFLNSVVSYLPTIKFDEKQSPSEKHVTIIDIPTNLDEANKEKRELQKSFSIYEDSVPSREEWTPSSVNLNENEWLSPNNLLDFLSYKDEKKN